MTEADAGRDGPARRRGSWVVLMYHRLGEGGAGREPGEEIYTVRERDFAHQMELLRDHGHPVRDLHDIVSEAPDAGGRGVALTFDDGSHSDVATAAPMLARSGFRATFFVTPAWIGSSGFMEWNDVRELRRMGMSIGAHGLDHRPMSSLSEIDLKRQLREARREIASRIGAEVAALSLPGGAGGAREWRAAREEGFRIVAGSVPGRLRVPGTREIVPRYAVRRADSLHAFLALADQRPRALFAASGRYTALRLLRRSLGEARYRRLRARWGNPQPS